MNVHFWFVYFSFLAYKSVEKIQNYHKISPKSSKTGIDTAKSTQYITLLMRISAQQNSQYFNWPASFTLCSIFHWTCSLQFLYYCVLLLNLSSHWRERQTICFACFFFIVLHFSISILSIPFNDPYRKLLKQTKYPKSIQNSH